MSIWQRIKIIAKTCAALILISTGVAAQTQPGGQAALSPWGSEDEIGRLNMMTDASRLSALSQITTGKVYDLSVDLFVGMPTCCSEAFGDPSYQIWMTHTPSRGDSGELLAHSGDAVSLSTHTGTHIDTLNHFGLKGEIWNQVSADEALTVRGWTRSGAGKYPPILARGVLIDVAKAKKLDRLPPSYAITTADLQQALDAQGTTLSPGDVVLLRTGLMSLWPDRAAFGLFTQPGLGLEAARWLAEEQQVMLVGADNLGLESFPSTDPGNFAPVHSYLLAEQGISMIEVLWLEELAQDEIYEFLFVAAPLKLRGASGSPIRPVAIPLRSGT